MKKILASLSAMFLGAVSMNSITAMENPTKSETEANNFEAQKTRFQQAYNRYDFQKMIDIINQVNPTQVSALLEIAKGLNVLHLGWYLQDITGLKIIDAINTIPHEKFVQNYPGLLPNAASHSKTEDDLFDPDFLGEFQTYKKLAQIPCFSKEVADEIKKDYSSMDDNDKHFVFYLAIKHKDLDLAANILQFESQSENVGEKYADLFNLVSGLITSDWLLSPEYLEARRIEARRIEAQKIEEARRKIEEEQKFQMLKSEFIQAMPSHNQVWDLFKMCDIIGQIENLDQVSELLKLAEGINVIHLMRDLENKTGLKIIDAINTIPHKKFVQNYPGLSSNAASHSKTVDDLFKNWGLNPYFYKRSWENYDDVIDKETGTCPYFLSKFQKYTDLAQIPYFSEAIANRIEKDYPVINSYQDRPFVFFLAIKHKDLDLAAKILQFESKSENVGEKYADLFNLVSGLITPRWLLSPDHLEALKIEEARRKFEAMKVEFTQAFQRADLSKMLNMIKQVKDSNHILELLKLTEGINVVHLMWDLENKTGLKIVDAINLVENRCNKYPHLELGIKNFNENGGRFNLKDIVAIKDLFKGWGDSSYFRSNVSYQYLTDSNYLFLDDRKAARAEKDYSTMNENDKRFAFFLAIRYWHLDLAAKILQIESKNENVGEKYADLFNLVSRLITSYWLTCCSSISCEENNGYLALSCVSYGGKASRDVLNYCREIDLFKNASDSIKYVLVDSLQSVEYGEHVLEWAKECRSYMDDSQLAVVASVDKSYEAEQLTSALQDFFKWLIENKGRERAVNIIGRSFAISVNDREHIRTKLINQLFNDEEKLVMLNTALSETESDSDGKDIASKFSKIININDENGLKLIKCLVSVYKQNNDIKKLGVLIESIYCYDEHTRHLLFKIFLNEFEWTSEELKRIAKWRWSSLFYYAQMTDQQVEQLINDIVSEYEKDKDMQKLEKSFQELMGCFEAYDGVCDKLSSIFLRHEWSEEKLHKIREWKTSPFCYKVEAVS